MTYGDLVEAESRCDSSIADTKDNVVTCSANEPARERQPGVGVAKGDASRERQCEEQSTPQRDGVDTPLRPIVVRNDGDDEENGDAEKRPRPVCIQYPYAAERGR